MNRPEDPARFSGVVVANWNNVSAGFEVLYGRSPLLYESGWAWVGVSAQQVGVQGHAYTGTEGLRGWDERRYRSLSIPDDDASFDIFSQAIEAVVAGQPL